MSENIKLTCDRKGGLARVAVWRGPVLQDLYLDRLERPDPTGALVIGKIVRVVAGKQAAWVDAGLDEKVFIEKTEGLQAGKNVLVEIKAAGRQGKAHMGALCENKEVDLSEIGIVSAAPAPWRRAMADLKTKKFDSIVFEAREDFLACQKWMEEVAPQFLSCLSPLSKTPVHPELEEILEDLLEDTVSLTGNASLIIETTQALVAIDVNAEKGVNALSVNLAAAQEKAHQIRLRNLSGIILLDALKMPKREDHAKLLNALKRATAEDPAGVDVFGITKLGLVEMTRRRRGPSVTEVWEE